MPAGILFYYTMVVIQKVAIRGKTVAVDLDDGERLIIPVELYSVYSIQAGAVITDIQYRQMKDESERFLCREKALTRLASRSRSRHEILQFLKKKGFSEYIVNDTVQQILESGYLDDFSYALDYIRIRKSRKTVGKNALIRELNQKGVPRTIISRAIRESDADRDDMDEMFRIAKKKYDSIRNRKNRLAKVGQFLQGRGFEFGSIRSVLNRLKADDDSIDS